MSELSHIKRPLALRIASVSFIIVVPYCRLPDFLDCGDERQSAYRFLFSEPV